MQRARAWWRLSVFLAAMGWVLRRLLWAGLLALVAVQAARASEPLDPVSWDLAWCATPADTPFEAVAAGACAWQAQKRSDLTQGWDDRAFWLRLNLHNAGDTIQERWLEVGHSQMAEISLHAPHQGSMASEVGAGTPMSERRVVERIHGVLPVQLLPRTRHTVWVRLASDTVIILRARLWEPDEFRMRQQQRHFWISLGAGGLILIIVFSLLMLALTRQTAYGFFALGLAGQFITYNMTSGTLQRFFWPEGWALTSASRNLGSMIAIFGFYRFLLAFLPHVQRHPVGLAVLRGVVYTSLCLMLTGLLGADGVHRLWFVTVLFCGLQANFLSFMAWRDGDRAAGIMMAAFTSLFVFAAIRVMVLFGVLDFAPELAQVPFLGIFLTSPLMLLGLVDRTRQLQEELTRVQAESAAQLRFLAQMSHELRSPLDNVLGNAQLLAREARSPSQINGIHSIFDSGRQLLRIIDHILDYARGVAGMLRIEPAPMRLGTFLRGMERMAQLLAVQCNNRFVLQIEGDPQALKSLVVQADAERLRQVLGNLLGNAARHTADGVITLHVQATRGPDSTVQLDWRVDDTGEGISPSEQERIFKPFERADSRAQYGGKGAGLGLAIARQLVELMGGRLSVRSVPGQGASFRFSVPLLELASQDAPATERLEGFDAAGYLGPRRSVLVVDDERGSRNVLGQLLEGLGFEVIQARSGTEAASLLRQLPRLDLVLTDQYMPDGDGWTVLEAVAKLHSGVPVVMISAAPPSPPPKWNPQLRFAAQFLRPLDHALVLARIGDLLDLAWTERPVSQAAEAAQAHPLVPTGDPTAKAQSATLAPHELQTLAQMVELGQITAIQDWARRLQAAQPEHAAFALLVLEAVHRLDLPALLDLVSGAGEGSVHPDPAA